MTWDTNVTLSLRDLDTVVTALELREHFEDVADDQTMAERCRTLRHRLLIAFVDQAVKDHK